MSEELLQRDLLRNPLKFGRWDFYNIGSTSIKTLKEHGIIRNVDYGDEEKKKVDGLIVQKKNVIAVIEYKKPSEFKTNEQKNKAINQELEVARKLKAFIIIATDTIETIWINVKTGNKIKDENGVDLSRNFDIKDEKLPDLIEKIINAINELNDQIKPKKLVNPTDLAKRIWQDIWSVSGATPENCLYTFVELFIFKYLSDLGILQGIFSFTNLLNNYTENNNDEMLEYYASTIRPKIKNLFPENPVDKTTIINGTIFVSKDQKAVKGYSRVFKKILDKFSDYGKLENIDYDFKSQLFESFLKESISKKNWGQFFTPLKIVRSVVEMAKDDIKIGAKICDPACGVGKFLLEPLITKLDEFYEIKNGKLTPRITIRGFDKGFDKDEQKTIILAKANMLIYFSDLIKENSGITKEFSGLFNQSFELKTNSILGTLSETVENEYDLILTNPPYVTSGSSNLKEEIKKDGALEKYYKINAMGVEGLFMEWIIRALKPNGKAFIIIPDGILNRQNDRNLRQFIIDECYIDGIISLPIKTFFTTPKKTYLLCITKKGNKKDIQIDPIFTYLVSEIGESRDIYRFDIEQNDLSEAITLYSFFKGNKLNFSKINNDKRCKIQPFDKFKPENHWSVDRWWTKEEQIDLGILNEENSTDLTGFSELISDISNTLSDFSSVINEIAEKKKSITNFESIHLSNVDFFELSIGKRILKKDIFNINGNIPIFSANVKEPIGFHTQSNITDFSNNFVLWGIDGDFEFNAIPKNQPFVSTDHCGTIRIKKDEILPKYLMIQLENIKYKYGFDRGLRASLKNMEEVVVDIPFDKEKNIDIVKQQEIIEKYEYILELKNKIEDYKKQIENLIVVYNNMDSQNFIFQSISNIFDLSIQTNNSNFTKSFIDKNKGDIPVYSASKFPENVDYGYVKDNLEGIKYFENCLTWNIDGSIGKVYLRKGKFSLSEKVIPLILKKEFNVNIDLLYLKYMIEKEFINYNFGFNNKASKGKINKIMIPIPIKQNGEYDLEFQKQIAEKYIKIEQIKKSILEELNIILNTKLDFE